MTIESALTSHLQTELAADVSLTFSVGVYPHIAPNTADYPFIVYSIQGADIEQYLNINTNTLTEIIFDLAVYAGKVSDRALIMTSLKNILHDFRGNMGTEGLDVRNSIINSVSTLAESDLTGTDEQIYRANLTLNLFYNWS